MCVCTREDKQMAVIKKRKTNVSNTNIVFGLFFYNLFFPSFLYSNVYVTVFK